MTLNYLATIVDIHRCLSVFISFDVEIVILREWAHSSATILWHLREWRFCTLLCKLELTKLHRSIVASECTVVETSSVFRFSVMLLCLIRLWVLWPVVIWPWSWSHTPLMMSWHSIRCSDWVATRVSWVVCHLLACKDCAAHRSWNAHHTRCLIGVLLPLQHQA